MEETELWEGRMVLWQQVGHRHVTVVIVACIIPGHSVGIRKTNALPDSRLKWIQAADLQPLKTKEKPK